MVLYRDKLTSVPNKHAPNIPDIGVSEDETVIFRIKIKKETKRCGVGEYC